MRIAVGVLVGCLWLLAEVGEADACACCDGAVEREVAGWSKSGKSVLFRTRAVHGCEQHDYMEIVRVKAKAAAGCYDLAANPNKRIACGDIGFHPRAARLGTSVEASRWFPATSTRLAADLVRARAVAADELAVDVFTNNGWKTVWTGPVSGRLNAHAEYAPTIPMPVEIHRAPIGKAALLLIDNDWEPNGNGADLVTRFEWIEVPATAAGADASESLARNAVPAFRTETIDARSRRASRNDNRRGLAKHRAKKYGAAIGGFVDALVHDPANPMARYNLACAYARLGLTNRAIGQLEVLARAGCRKCPARIKRAGVDEDLASLRGDERFKALIGK